MIHFQSRVIARNLLPLNSALSRVSERRAEDSTISSGCMCLSPSNPPRRSYSEKAHSRQADGSAELALATPQQLTPTNTLREPEKRLRRKAPIKEGEQQTYRYTLDPGKLTRDHFIDLPPRPSDFRNYLILTAAFTAKGGRKFTMRDVPSATHLRGFLYYHLPPGAPPLAAEIRFRVTGSPDPAFFSSSPDLMTQHGLPWRIPLLNLVRHRRRLPPDPLWLVLVEDGLVSEDQLLSDSQVDIPKELSPSMNTRLIYGFGQPFLLDFSACQPQFRLVGHDRHEVFRLQVSPYIRWRRPYIRIYSMFSSESSPCGYERIPYAQTLRIHRGYCLVLLREVPAPRGRRRTYCCPPRPPHPGSVRFLPRPRRPVAFRPGPSRCARAPRGRAAADAPASGRRGLDSAETPGGEVRYTLRQRGARECGVTRGVVCRHIIRSRGLTQCTLLHHPLPNADLKTTGTAIYTHLSAPVAKCASL